jgi:uncharacterized iron-regulated protein
MRTYSSISALVLLLAACVMSIESAAAQHADSQDSPAATTTSPDSSVSETTTMTPGAHAIYTSGGDPATMDDIIAAADTVDVVFVGEVHDDETAHALQILLFDRLVESTTDRAVALSLEMFERDVQPVLDEYLAGTISENHFVDDARAWQNYVKAYHPMVEQARAKNLVVLAANAPRRYVSQVARGGQSALNGLSDWARQWVAPLPFPGPTEAYQDKWNTLMRQAMPPGHGSAAPDTSARQSPHGAQEGAHGSTGPSTMLQAQSLWDATMAYTIAEHLTRQPQCLIMHVTGAFHVSRGSGTPEALQHYRPGTRDLVVLIRPTEDPEAFDLEEHAGLGDFLILTGEGR